MNEPSKKQTQYSAQQFADNYPQGMENNHWIYARSLFVRQILRRYQVANTNILEIGCGAGIVLDFLARSGLNCRGVELGTPHLIASVESLAWTGIRFQELDQTYRNSVQMVLLLDVIEHIEDPDTFLRDITGSFPNLKSILITVPARQELWSNYDDYFGHYRRYDRDSLSSSLSKNGYEVGEVGYFFHSLYLPMFAFSKLGLKRRVKNSGPQAVWLHRLLSYWHLLESSLLPKRLIGSSLYAVARTKGA